MNFTFFCLMSLVFLAELPQEQSPMLNPSASLLETTETPYGSIKRVVVSAEAAAEHELGLTEILRCETTSIPRNAWEFIARMPVDREVNKGETLLLRFHARTVYARTESGLGVIQAFFEKDEQPHTKSLNRQIEIGRQWKEYSIPFKVVESYDAEKSAVGVFLGFQEQIVEIGNFSLHFYGTEFDITTIPDTVPQYRGQELDAPWRKAAEQRIEQIRKGNMQIKVVDANGHPIANAKAEIRMIRHAFGWGSAVVARRFSQQDADNARYREIIEKYFNRVVFENDMKWYSWENERNRENVYRAVEWLQDHKIDIRGHCLLWPSWRNTPRYLRELENEPDKLREAIREHFRDEVTAMRGKIINWDVINEPYDNNDIIKILGNQEMVEWFKLAKESDPNAKLYLNDYGILSGEGLDLRHQNFMFDTLKYLVANGATIDGIGFQGHFGATATSPERLLDILDRFAEFELPITVTEHDIDTRDEKLQAEFTRDFLTAMFSHPAVEAVLVWGFWERSHWRPNAAYYRADWSLKPAGQTWLDLVTKQWWSNFDEKTNVDGVVTVRGFLGDYEITVQSDGQSKTIETNVSKEDTLIEIQIH